jgi:hypothetical protein
MLLPCHGPRPRHLQRAQPAGWLRHLRPPGRRLRPGHRSPNPARQPGHPRRLRPRLHCPVAVSRYQLARGRAPAPARRRPAPPARPPALPQ